LHNAIIRAINLLASDKDELVSTIRESLCIALKGYGDNDNPYMIESRIKELNSDMLDLVQLSAKSGSDSEKYDEQFKSIADETRRLQEILVMQDSQKSEDTKTRSNMNELFSILESEALTMTEFDNTLVKQLINTIKVKSKDKILIIFNGGFEMEQTLCK
jgi:ribosomal protein L16 Arg81 hydroxylase